ncbi:hypothetical protein CWM58_03505 [Klebsiella sp. H-Nf2]|nr:hypothetical protein [Klebsiella sp. H-Nf2]PJR52213.1 hypothetical protein CWM58_03505 [Klebsiella sp. H-Nf2]
MKKHFAQFYAFITEQQSWFEQHLAADFEQSWDDPVWVCGSNGSGWLRGNGKNKMGFKCVSGFHTSGWSAKRTSSTPFKDAF